MLTKKLWGIVLPLLFVVTQLFADFSVQLTYSEWPPGFSKHLPGGGPVMVKVSEAFKKLPNEHRFVWYPDWKKAFKTAQGGRHNGAVGWRCNNERRQNFFFSLPVAQTRQMFWHLKTTPFKRQPLTGLNKFGTVGINDGYSYGLEFDTLVKKGKIKVDKSLKEVLSFRMLLHGRIGSYILEEQVGKKILEDNFSKEEREKITMHPKPVNVSFLHVLLNKQNTTHRQLLRTLDEVLKNQKDIDFDSYYNSVEYQCVKKANSLL